MFSSNLFAIATSLLLVTLPTLGTAQSSDPCAVVAGKQIATYSEAKACLEHFPYNQTIADETIDIVRKITDDMYIFNVRLQNYFYIQRHTKNRRTDITALRKSLQTHLRLTDCPLFPSTSQSL